VDVGGVVGERESGAAVGLEVWDGVTAVACADRVGYDVMGDGLLVAGRLGQAGAVGVGSEAITRIGVTGRTGEVVVQPPLTKEPKRPRRHTTTAARNPPVLTAALLPQGQRCPGRRHTAKKGARGRLPVVRSAVMRLRHCVFRDLDDLSECILISNGEVGQDLPIQGDVRFLQTMDEPAVWHVTLSSCCVDPRDPKPSKVPPSLTSVPVCVPLGLHPSFVGPSIKMMSRAPIALRVSKDLLVSATSVSSTLYSHCTIAPLDLKTHYLLINYPLKNESAFSGGSCADPSTSSSV